MEYDDRTAAHVSGNVVQTLPRRDQPAVIAAQHIPHHDVVTFADAVRLRRLDPRIGRTEQIGMQDIVREIDIFEVTFETHAPTFLVTVGMVADAYNAIADIVADGGSILFVGTKKQAQDAIKTEAERCGQFYVNERWLGGMLTNFRTIQSRIARLKEIETMSEDGTFDVLPKKEVIALKKEWDKLEKNLGGIKDMKRIPDAIFIVDPKKERICVQEAQSLGITLIGIADTNCDPDELDYVIPGNDDAIRAVKLIVSKMADAVIEAKQGTEEVAAEAAEETVEE